MTLVMTVLAQLLQNQRGHSEQNPMAIQSVKAVMSEVLEFRMGHLE